MDTQGGHHVKGTVESGAMHLQIKEHRGSAGNHQKLEEAKDDPSLGPWGAWPFRHYDVVLWYAEL